MIRLNIVALLRAVVMQTSRRLNGKRFQQHDHFSKVLEIGAGTEEHLGTVQHDFDKYILSDMDPKTLDVAKCKLSDKIGNNLMFETQSGEELSYTDDSFDRLIAPLILKHIYQPQVALKEWMHIVKNGGALSIIEPTDPGIAWRLGRHFGLGKMQSHKALPTTM